MCHLSAIQASLTTTATASQSGGGATRLSARLRAGFERIDARLAPFRRSLVWLVTIAMLVWLGFQLDAIGWARLWTARPLEPAFYLLVLAAYLVLPVADTLIYRRLWGIGFWASLGVFLRKRVYNSVVLGYSGEVGLLVWARTRIGRSDAQIVHAIKDTNILSAMVSAVASVGLVAWLALHVAYARLPIGAIGWWGGVTIAATGLLPFGLFLRGKVLALDRRDTLAVLAIHGARFALGMVLLVAQWRVALPGSMTGDLVILLAVQVLVGRIPLVPNRDVLFVGIALAISRNLGLAHHALASVLIVTSALQQGLHPAVFALSTVIERRRP